MNEKVGTVGVINCYFQHNETICRHLSKRLPDNSTIFAAEANMTIIKHWRITKCLIVVWFVYTFHHDVVVCSDTLPCLQTIAGEGTENPFICNIVIRLWLMSDKGTCAFLMDTKPLWHWGNTRVGQLAKETLCHDRDGLVWSHWSTPRSNSWFK